MCDVSCGEECCWGLASKGILAGAGAGGRPDVCKVDTGRRDILSGSMFYFRMGKKRATRPGNCTVFCRYGPEYVHGDEVVRKNAFWCIHLQHHLMRM